MVSVPVSRANGLRNDDVKAAAAAAPTVVVTARW